MPRVSGIHHVTAVAGAPQENLSFYAGTLGLRLVKRSVNQDDPHTYHLFYADAEGHPGTDLTFFPWARGRHGRPGAGQTTEVSYAIPPGSLGYWQERLTEAGLSVEKAADRFGAPALTFQDPHGLHLALVASEATGERAWSAFPASPVPAEHQLRGFHAVRVLEHAPQPTTEVVTDVLGMEQVDQEAGWARFQASEPSGGFLEMRVDEAAPRAMGGVGTIHHVAWRVADAEEGKQIAKRAAEAGLSPTDVIDRFWFKSIYFREPGGVLFELATEGPGFDVDEAPDALGERLVLPPWLEDQRESIEASLPALELPYDPQAPS